MTIRTNTPYLRIVRIPAPLVASELTITGPGQGLWRIMNLAFTLTTDANVANRAVDLIATDGTSQYFNASASAVQAAGVTRLYTAHEGSTPAAGASGDSLFSWPTRGLWLDAGHILSTATALIQAGDQYSEAVLQVEEFPTGGKTFWLPTVDRAEY
jgi:hypothetical protein